MIAAVLLAAGSARRFDGTQKLLAQLSYQGMPVPLVRLAALGLVEAGLERIVVVVGREAELVRERLTGLDVQFVANPAYDSGMSSSLRAGVEEAIRHWPDSHALLIALGDQPLVGSGTVEALAAAFEGSGGGVKIAAPRYRGEPGTPVLFVRELVPELLGVSGDHGARGVVRRDPARVAYVDFDRPAPVDVDTVEDLAAFSAGLRNP
jgi:molybdenum cofactor cytidylyltransferase